MPEIIEMINSSLEFHQDKVNEFSMRYQAVSQSTFKPKIRQNTCITHYVRMNFFRKKITPALYKQALSV